MKKDFLFLAKIPFWKTTNLFERYADYLICS